jgi:NAD(P)-dependent dehydrogenase (short-subunit alcohol dehydrogenase family)
MDLQLEGKVVIVTGTSRGIGAGIGARLHEEGAKVVGVSRRAPDGHVAWMDAHVAADVRRADAPEEIVDRVLDHAGTIDGLVNNAGVHHAADCWAQSEEDFDEMMLVNLTAPFSLAQAVARHWVEDGRPGAVVNICSIESQVAWPYPGQAVYASTKGGLLGLTRAMAFDLAAARIRVNAVGPGSIETEMTPPDEETGLLSRIPLGGRLGTPREIGDAVAFLLSESAAYITGEILYVDGGYVLP